MSNCSLKKNVQTLNMVHLKSNPHISSFALTQISHMSRGLRQPKRMDQAAGRAPLCYKQAVRFVCVQKRCKKFERAMTTHIQLALLLHLQPRGQNQMNLKDSNEETR